MASVRLVHWILLAWTLCAWNIVKATDCPDGYNYPPACPREGTDPRTYTTCCRDGLSPACCEARTSMVCASNCTSYSRTTFSGTHLNPPPDYFARWCPQPGQADNFNKCDYVTCSNITCVENPNYHPPLYIGLGTILGVVFGAIALGCLILFIWYMIRKRRRGTYQQI